LLIHKIVLFNWLRSAGKLALFCVTARQSYNSLIYPARKKSGIF